MKHDKLVAEVLGEELTLSPNDLLNQQFSRALVGGYDKRQVDDFIERIADVFENLINQVRQLRDKNEDQRKIIDEYQQMETAMRTALVSSQQHGEHLLEMARREASMIIEEAKIERARTHEDATKVPATIARDIHLLENQRSRLRVDMLAILETHRRLLDSLVPDDAATPVGFFEVAANTSGAQLSFPQEPERLSDRSSSPSTSADRAPSDSIEMSEEVSEMDSSNSAGGANA